MNRKKILYRWVFLLLTTLALQCTINAQQVNVMVTVSPPYSPILSDYFSYEGRVVIILQNITSTTLDVKLGGSITGDNGVVIETNPSAVPASPITLAPGESRRLTISEIADLFNVDQLQISGTSRDRIIIDRVLPEGTYQICVRAYDYATTGHSAPLSSDLTGCSNPFMVLYLESPEIISIDMESCGATLTPSSPQDVTIQWTIPAGAPAGTEYTVSIVEIIPDDRPPVDAIRSASSFFLERTTTSPLLLIGPADPLFEEGRRYAVRIQASNTMAGSYFRNEGYSPVCWFQYGRSTSSSGLSLDAVYPANDDYIPFSYFPIIVKWREYDDNYNHFHSDYQLQASGVEVASYIRDLGWGFGPVESQRRATDFSELTREQAQYIAVNRNQSETPLHTFQRGVPYHWEADVNLTKFGSTRDYIADASEDFYVGMSRPQPLTPEDDAVVSPGDISLEFRTADPPTQLLPPFSIVQAYNASGAQFFNGFVNEKWALEVSRETDFSSVIDTATGKVGRDFDLNSPDESAIIADLYKNVTNTFNYTDTGYYYWRIKWLNNPDGFNLSDYYNISETYRFYIGESSTPPTDSTTARRGECVDGCDAIPVPASERVAVSSFSVDDEVQIGRFTMKLTRINWSGTTGSGQGTIMVPFFNAPMRVEFTGLQVNAAGKVYSGTVTGMEDNSTIIPPGMTGPLSSMTGMSDDEADALNTYVSQSSRLISAFTGDDPVGLPIGLDHVIDGQRYTIAVVGLRFTPDRATLDAVFSIDVPELRGWLSLGASDICFHENGIAGLERGMLYNPVDKVIPFSDDVNLTFKRSDFPSDSGTFVRWDCDGFQELRIKAEFTFPRDWFVPDSITGDPGSDNVKARFTTSVRRKGNWFTSLDFDPFQLADLPGWGFRVEDAVLDFSDLGNAEGMRFPVDYRGDRSVRWKGFYMKRLHVRLPEEFKTFDDPTRRLTFAVQDVLIDRTGLSGSLRAENIVRITEGDLDEWAFSLDTVHVDLVSNSFSRGGLNGGIKVPISDSELRYDMLLRRDTVGNFAYEFNIRPTDTLTADIWAAEMNILPTSRINITVDTAGFTAKADLSGSLTISGDLGALSDMDFSGIEFEGLVIQSRAPYISLRDYSFASPQHSAGGFPINLTDLELVTRDGPGLLETDSTPGPRAGLAFTVELVLTGETNTFHAAGRIAVLGRLNLGGGDAQRWEFSGISLDSVAVGGSVGVVEIDGALVFYNSHPTYGEGIKGYIRAAFKPTIEVSATAQFGSVDGYRYWYVDAMAEFNPGLTVFAGLAVNGFGGAAYYNMVMSDPPPFDQIGASSGDEGSSEPGTSPTHTTYIPTESTFGFEAKLLLGAPGGGNAYKAKVVFGANFNTDGGGIRQMYLNGDLFVMSDGDNPSEAQIYGSLRVSYDFPRNILDGRFELYVNVAGGIVRGVGEGNLAGWMHLYCSPETWFFKIGEPDRRVGIDIAGIFTSESYFMVGLDLPGMPPLPDKVASVLAVSNQRDPRLGTGDGFAFGTWTQFNTGRLGFLMFYARFGLGLGFDLSVLNFDGVTCDGAEGAGEIGIDGWYAQGQLYAYFEGDIGIYIDLWFVSGEYKILEIAAAAALRGGFPNPSWMKGNVGGRYSILGGAVKGSCHFEAQVGQECTPPVENPLADLEVIADLSPPDREEDVDCGVEPQALFNIPPEQIFDITVINDAGDERVRTFRIMHRDLQLTNDSRTIEGRQVSSSDSILLTLTPDDYLDPYKWYDLSITAYVDEYQSNRWAVSERLDGSEISKDYLHKFKTGAYPDHIRARDVLYSYPFHNQRFFLQDECRIGMLKLKSGMSRLFNQEPSGENREWKYYAEFIPVERSAMAGTDGPLRQELNVSGSSITFEVPMLQNNTVYAIRLIAVNEFSGTSLSLQEQILARANIEMMESNRGVIVQDLSTRRYMMDNIVQVKTGRIDATKVKINEKLLYVWYFKTSQFNTLTAKVDALSSPSSSYSNFGNFEQVDIDYNPQEQFDVFDVEGYSYERYGRTNIIPPLVGMTAEWGARWHNSFTDPYIYDLLTDMRNEGLTREYFRRNYRKTGIPPVHTVKFANNYYPKSELRESEFMPLPPSTSSSSGTLSGITGGSTLPGFGMTISPSTISFGTTMTMTTSSLSAITMMTRLHLSYITGIYVPLDYTAMKGIAGRVVGTYGLWSSEFMPVYLKYRISRTLYYPYVKMYRGRYGINFNYHTPSQCVDPDDFSGSIRATKYFNL